MQTATRLDFKPFEDRIEQLALAAQSYRVARQLGDYVVVELETADLLEQAAADLTMFLRIVREVVDALNDCD